MFAEDCARRFLDHAAADAWLEDVRDSDADGVEFDTVDDVVGNAAAVKTVAARARREGGMWCIMLLQVERLLADRDDLDAVDCDALAVVMRAITVGLDREPIKHMEFLHRLHFSVSASRHDIVGRAFPCLDCGAMVPIEATNSVFDTLASKKMRNLADRWGRRGGVPWWRTGLVDFTRVVFAVPPITIAEFHLGFAHLAEQNELFAFGNLVGRFAHFADVIAGEPSFSPAAAIFAVTSRDFRFAFPSRRIQLRIRLANTRALRSIRLRRSRT